MSQERAVEIARPQVDFTPEGHNIRFVRTGHSAARLLGGVLLDHGHADRPSDRCQVVEIDASTGDVLTVSDC